MRFRRGRFQIDLITASLPFEDMGPWSRLQRILGANPF
jgi:hypothetical protein